MYGETAYEGLVMGWKALQLNGKSYLDWKMHALNKSSTASRQQDILCQEYGFSFVGVLATGGKHFDEGKIINLPNIHRWLTSSYGGVSSIYLSNPNKLRLSYIIINPFVRFLLMCSAKWRNFCEDA